MVNVYILQRYCALNHTMMSATEFYYVTHISVFINEWTLYAFWFYKEALDLSLANFIWLLFHFVETVCTVESKVIIWVTRRINLFIYAICSPLVSFGFSMEWGVLGETTNYRGWCMRVCGSSCDFSRGHTCVREACARVTIRACSTYSHQPTANDLMCLIS